MIVAGLFVLGVASLLGAVWVGRRFWGAGFWRRVIIGGLVCLLGLVGVLAVASGGYGYWYTHRTQPAVLREGLFRGVDYVRDVRQAPRPIVIHVVTIDLRAPGLRFFVTPGEALSGRDIRARKTSAFLEKFGVQVAINANYFYPFRSESPFDYFPHAGDGVDLCGYAASEGKVYSNKPWRAGTLYISRDNVASFDYTISPIYNAISGGGFILRAGVVQPPPLIADEKDQPYPRAALGLSADTNKMMLFIIDGKQPGYSEGATLGELGAIVREHGALNAIRLDEGGSCALAVEERAGRARLLNVPINNRIPYRERVVGNQLGVFAERVR